MICYTAIVHWGGRRCAKNTALALLRGEGIQLSAAEKAILWTDGDGEEARMTVYERYAIPHHHIVALESHCVIVHTCEIRRKKLCSAIAKATRPFQDEITRLMTIPGISMLTAAAFCADVGDVTRFPSMRKLSAYLGLAPTCHASGGHTTMGHIMRNSRSLTRTMLTQSVVHAVTALGTRALNLEAVARCNYPPYGWVYA